MKILLTGANSFIGSHIAQHLLDAGHTLIATYRKSNAACRLLTGHPAAPAMVMLDLASSDHFDILPNSIDAIVHVAGISMTRGIKVEDMLTCNVLGTQNIIRYASRVGAGLLIHASTLSVHGRIEEMVVNESTPVREPGIYGGSKYLAERLIEAESAWLSAFAIRLPGVLGVGAPLRAWIPKLIARLMQNEELTIYNPNAPFNNAAHVADVSYFCRHLLESGGEGFKAFPIGAAGIMSISEAVSLLSSAVGSRSRIKTINSLNSGFTICSAKANSLGYRPMDINTMLCRFASESFAII